MKRLLKELWNRYHETLKRIVLRLARKYIEELLEDLLRKVANGEELPEMKQFGPRVDGARRVMNVVTRRAIDERGQLSEMKRKVAK